MCLLAQGVDWFSLVAPNVINCADSMYVVIVCTCLLNLDGSLLRTAVEVGVVKFLFGTKL